MVRVLFLDIDGVICTLRSHLAFGTGLLMQAWDITSCHMIKKLCDKHDLKIVVSSTWRLGRAHDCKMQMMIYGLWDYIYGNDDKDWKTPSGAKIRGEEIEYWIKHHPEVEQYFILDDDTDFLEHQRPYHIKTDSYDGFSSQDYIRLEEMLNA